MTDAAEWEDKLRAVGRLLPPEMLADLLALNHEDNWSCPAHSEGQTCCLDILTGTDRG